MMKKRVLSLLFQIKGNCIYSHWFHGYSPMLLSSSSCLRILQLQVGRHNFTSGLKILVFSSSNFGLNTLQTLHDDCVKEKKIVKSVNLITGGNTPMRGLAEQRGIPILQYPPDLVEGQYDVGVVVSFGHLIPGRVIEKFPHGVLNVHPSLLPRWRGAAPITHTILAGDAVTGVTIMGIRPKRFDIGPILMQETFPVPCASTTISLSEQLSRLGARMLLETLSDLDAAQMRARPQCNDKATYAHKTTTDMTYVNWSQQTRVEIDRQYRALHQTIPLRSRYQGKVIQLLDMVPLSALRVDENDEVPCGMAKYSKNDDYLRVRCKDGWVGFKNVVYKKPMTAASFHNGYLSKDYNRHEVLESIENTVLKFINQAKISS